MSAESLKLGGGDQPNPKIELTGTPDSLATIATRNTILGEPRAENPEYARGVEQLKYLSSLGGGVAAKLVSEVQGTRAFKADQALQSVREGRKPTEHESILGAPGANLRFQGDWVRE